MISTIKKNQWRYARHLIACLLFYPSVTIACDICGCGVGGYYIGILPEFNKKVVGLRYRHNSLSTHLGAGGQTSYLTTHERYVTTELWSGWTIGKKIRLLATIPLNFIRKVNQESKQSDQGLGDASVQAIYQVFSKQQSVGTNLMIHSFWLGGGLKLPTGRYSTPEKNGVPPSANLFQLGSGSLDFMLNAMYDLRIQDAGINTNLNYRINTRNAEAYRYGNKFNGNLQAYYKFRIKQIVTVAPNIGVSLESSQRDVDDNFSMLVSGGYAWLGTVGLEASFKRFAIGTNFQQPFAQELANGFVHAGNRGMLHLSILF